MPPRNRAQSTPATEETTAEHLPAAGAKRGYTAPPSDLLDRLEAVEFVEDNSNAFGRGSREVIPEDHKLVLAFEATYRAQKAAKFETDEPDASINILRRIAADRGKGIRTSVTQLDGRKIKLPERKPGERSPRYADVTKGANVYVVFMGREKKNYTRKVSDGTGTSGELPADAE